MRNTRRFPLRSVQLSISSPRIFSLAPLCLLLAGLLGCGSSTPSVGVSSTKFDYGNVAIGTSVRRIAVTVTNSSKTDITAAPVLSGSSDFTLGSGVSCSGTITAGSKCMVVVLFAPTIEGSQTAVVDLGLSDNNERVPLTGNGVQLQPGQSIITSTDNPLVARYTYSPANSGAVSVQFGPDANYGFQTSAQNASAGSAVSFLVAGMRANSTYHMRAKVAASDGTSLETDVDQTFATSSFAAETLPTVSVTKNGTPQPGVELLNPVIGPNSTYLQAVALDLQGNVIWGYDYLDRRSDSTIQPIKLLPNGDFLAVISIDSRVSGPPAAGELIVLREIDLAGVPVRQITLDGINSSLSSAGFDISLDDIHHDVELTPSGHFLVLGNTLKDVNGLPGASGATSVLGDVVVDLDPNLNAVWAWNEFDHLDPARAPIGYPDWTHSNALLYVPGDGNLIVSSRHQSWLVKVDYRNGAGTGNLLWRLGYQGDFTLNNGTSPKDWFYGQHQPSFYGTATTGVFGLTMMDNGFSRQLTPGNPCSGSTCYTTVPLLSIDENAKTATILWRDTLDPSKYSLFAGGTTVLANGNIEFDLCTQPNTTAEVDEVTVTTPIQTVWTLKVTGQNLYRANRLPSLYPGVQW